MFNINQTINSHFTTNVIELCYMMIKNFIRSYFYVKKKK